MMNLKDHTFLLAFLFLCAFMLSVCPNLNIAYKLVGGHVPSHYYEYISSNITLGKAWPLIFLLSYLVTRCNETNLVKMPRKRGGKSKFERFLRGQPLYRRIFIVNSKNVLTRIVGISNLLFRTFVYLQLSSLCSILHKF